MSTPESATPDPFDPRLPRLDVNLPDEWWQESPTTAYLHQLARARRVSPLALLGGVLALVGRKSWTHGVELPPIVGTRRPILLAVVAVGPVGSGKSSAFTLARDVVGSHKSPASTFTEVRTLADAAALVDAPGTADVRQLWLPANDPDLPDARPAEPEPLRWRPLLSQTFRPDAPLDVSASVVDAVDAAWLPVMRGDPDEAAGVGSAEAFLRLDVAAALTLLDTRASVTDDDWQRADAVVDASCEVRGRVTAGCDQ